MDNKTKLLNDIEGFKTQISEIEAQEQTFCFIRLGGFIISLTICIFTGVAISYPLYLLFGAIALAFLIGGKIQINEYDRQIETIQKDMYEKCNQLVRAYPTMLNWGTQTWPRFIDLYADTLEKIRKTQQTLNSYTLPNMNSTVYRLNELFKLAIKKLNDIETSSKSFSSIITYDNHIEKFAPLKQYRDACVQIEQTCGFIQDVFKSMNIQALPQLTDKLEGDISRLQIFELPVEVDNLKTKLTRACNTYFGESTISNASYMHTIEAAAEFVESHPDTPEAKLMNEKMEQLLNNFQNHKDEVKHANDQAEFKQLLDDLETKNKQLKFYI